MAKKISPKPIPIKRKQKEKAILPMVKQLAEIIQSMEVRLQELEEIVKLINKQSI